MSFRRKTRSLSPAARRHLPRLLRQGWRLDITASGLVTLELPGEGDGNFEARGYSISQAVEVARHGGMSFWVPGETSGATFGDWRGGQRLARRRRVATRLWRGQAIESFHPRDRRMAAAIVRASEGRLPYVEMTEGC